MRQMSNNKLATLYELSVVYCYALSGVRHITVWAGTRWLICRARHRRDTAPQRDAHFCRAALWGRVLTKGKKNGVVLVALGHTHRRRIWAHVAWWSQCGVKYCSIAACVHWGYWSSVYSMAENRGFFLKTCSQKPREGDMRQITHEIVVFTHCGSHINTDL